MRWTDLARWVGPTPNQSGAMVEHRGLVLHIADGSYEGTIAWQRNPTADVSSHFIVSKTGAIAQMVDTDVTAWTQRAGNGHWLSVENEGRGGQRLTDQQIEANARLLARAHRVYRVPLQLATSPSGRGLGHHSMGAESGVNWGHASCPGEPIKAQKSQILARAKVLAGATTQEETMAITDDDVTKFWTRDTDSDGQVNEPAWVALHNARRDAAAALEQATRAYKAAATAQTAIAEVQAGVTELLNRAGADAEAVAQLLAPGLAALVEAAVVRVNGRTRMTVDAGS